MNKYLPHLCLSVFFFLDFTVSSSLNVLFLFVPVSSSALSMLGRTSSRSTSHTSSTTLASSYTAPVSGSMRHFGWGKGRAWSEVLVSLSSYRVSSARRGPHDVGWVVVW